MKRSKQKILAIIILTTLIFTGCGAQVGTYSLSSDLLSHMWNMDYNNYDATELTNFVQNHYEQEHMEDYMNSLDISESGVKDNKIVSRLISTQDLGVEQVVIGEETYDMQKVLAKVHISSYDSADPSYFEVGDFSLIYNFYFEDLKIAGFDYAPEEGAFVPAEEKTPLTDEQSAQVEEYCEKYLDLRYELSYETFDPATTLGVYEQICHEQFMEWEGINIESLRAQSQEFKEHLVKLTLQDVNIEVAPQKQAVYDGEVTQFYYHAELNYTYAADTDEEFLEQYSMQTQNSVKETLYFEFYGDELKIIFGEYA